jgi:cytochrome c-type biogenesis protein CcmH/NrfF
MEGLNDSRLIEALAIVALLLVAVVVVVIRTRRRRREESRPMRMRFLDSDRDP